MRDRVLIEWLPDFLHGYKELKVINEAEDIQFDKLDANIGVAFDNQFVVTANEYGIARFENILGITPKADETLEDRRFKVLGRLSSQLPYTETTLHQYLEALCGSDGYELEVDCENSKISVRVSLKAMNMFNDIKELVENVIPVNLLLELSQKYNRYKTFISMKYSEVAQFTFKELRERML